MTQRAIIVGASSDIGGALATHWGTQGWEILGTYRTAPSTAAYYPMVQCDLADTASIERCVADIAARAFTWDALVLCPASMEPIGPFTECDIDVWEQAVTLNFIRQARLVQQLLPLRNPAQQPLVLFFAGGGTNSAPLHYSAYTLSKIALIKLTELLDAEMPDVRFAILGPGWVNTKIHAQTLRAGNDASAGAAAETQRRLAADEFVPMEQVLNACDWLASAPKELVGGRNFSAAHDFKNMAKLENALRADPTMFTLRRAGNAVL